MILFAILLQASTVIDGHSVDAAIEAAETASDSAPKVDCVGQPTQLDMNVCSFQDFEEADEALKQIWELVVAKAQESDRWASEHNFEGGEFDRLQDAQGKWLIFRDAQCLYEIGQQEGGGTIWPLLQNGCLKRLTEARISELRRTLGQNS